MQIKNANPQILNTNLINIEAIKVPKRLIKFYTPAVVKKMGTKIDTKGDFYALHNFIFKIDNKTDAIPNAYFNLKFLQKHQEFLK